MDFKEEVVVEDALHYGIKYRSGRYPWGSGEDPYQHAASFMGEYKKLHAQGCTDKEISTAFEMSIREMRDNKSIASTMLRERNINQAVKLHDAGMSNTAAAKEMGINESTFRGLLAQRENSKRDQAAQTADFLEKQIATKKMVDVGTGVELELGVTASKLGTAVQGLVNDGYVLKKVSIDQVTNRDNQTTIKVLAAPGTTEKEIFAAAHNGGIKSVTDYTSHDNGNTFTPLQRPVAISSNRLMIRSKEEGGEAMDGVIELRRGVKDLSLGNSNYAQVRILIDGTHYCKGMAIYADDLPDGVDIRVNSNKSKSLPSKLDHLKPIKDDPDNPFGALIKAGGQVEYTDDDGIKKIGGINKLKEEGDWDHYSKNLASQFLAKQPQELIDRQLKLSKEEKDAEFNEIMSLTNPAIKKKLLIDFADSCDGAADDLKAAAFPRQSSKVILPCTGLKDNEVYAPTYKNGEHVCLVRFPHGGTFEIPELVVNNKCKQAEGVVGAKSIDAIGINANVAGKLSGADFDGDSVVVMPTNAKYRIKTSESLPGLVGFNTKDYKLPDSAPKMSDRTKGIEMGKATNLITDMTLQGATPDELERAVKHSMVVIDAQKHHLNYKLSEAENDIDGLKQKYQKREGGKYGGSSSLISRASAEVKIDQIKKVNPSDPKYIDPETGKRIKVQTGKEVTIWDKDENGNYYSKGVKKAQSDVTRMSLVDDARQLMSGPNHEGTDQEKAYADYANHCKALANEARKAYLNTGSIKMSASAKETYKEEVSSLKAKLNTALMNAPRERQAQLMATAIVSQKKKDNPNMTKEEYKKCKQNALSQSRIAVSSGKKHVQVNITDREWEAIQAGAVSDNIVTKILNNTDGDKFKQRALPKQTNAISASDQARIAARLASGYTIAEVAESLGLSTSTVSKYANPNSKND